MELDCELPADAVQELNSLERHERGAEPYSWGVDVFGEKGDEYAKEAARKHAENNPIGQ